jgi:protein-S-isoprenylcysteine O-methyltransferase Ste14
MSSPSNHQIPDDESQRKISELSLVEIGEKLFQWRDYIAIPILVVILLASNPTSRTSTIGTLLLLLGQVMRIYTVAFLGAGGSERGGQPEHIISHGPFAIIRNPLYLGNVVMILGILIYAGAPVLGFLSFVYFLFQYHCIAKYEESILLAKFGDEYERYLERVPAWIPLRVPTLEEFPVPPSFVDAVKAEKKSIALTGVILFLLLLAGK